MPDAATTTNALTTAAATAPAAAGALGSFWSLLARFFGGGGQGGPGPEYITRSECLRHHETLSQAMRDLSNHTNTTLVLLSSKLDDYHATLASEGERRAIAVHKRIDETHRLIASVQVAVGRLDERTAVTR